MAVNLRALIGKLNDTTRNALEAAAGLCLSRTHYDVEVEHYLMKLLDSSAATDLAAILKHFEVDKSRLAAELTRSLDKLKIGQRAQPGAQPHGAQYAAARPGRWARSIMAPTQVRTGFTILALATDEDLSRMMREVSKEFQKINADSLRKDFQQIVASSERRSRGCRRPPRRKRRRARGPAGGKTPNLDQFTVNLTENARAGQDRSGAGPRFRNPPGGGHPHAPPPEQSHSGRRSRRRQDRRGGRLRACASCRAMCRRC